MPADPQNIAPDCDKAKAAPEFLRSRLMGGNVLQGYAEFVPGPTPMTLGEEWVLCRAPAFDDLLEALKAALAILEGPTPPAAEMFAAINAARAALSRAGSAQ